MELHAQNSTIFNCFCFSIDSMAYGNEHGLVIVDIVQKICLLNVASPDLYGAQDPYSRTPRSPKRIDARDEQTRSPSIDQVSISMKTSNFSRQFYLKILIFLLSEEIAFDF